ncbi:hypothetical protein DPX16_1686 [Anabarilius grahami]|uniref:Uncharacterized protein n=1 Tax=Anabarilius grahami TaxID=495550 RepID=A0A3N0XJ40_ANAGA|nr:hypothetical protein DPX16_1686 [Anabarilius grahami]
MTARQSRASLWRCSAPKLARKGGAYGYISGQFAIGFQNEAVSDETPHNPSNQNQNAAESFELRPMLETEEQEAGRDRDRGDAA